MHKKKQLYDIITGVKYLSGTRCQLLLLNVTVQAHLEEMKPESESDGPNGDVGNASLAIYTALKRWCVPDSPGCVSTLYSPKEAK